MGCMLSIEEKEARGVNDKIDQQLKEEGIEAEKTPKMLLLGSGESGKSTILKQLRLLHGSGFSEEERVSYKAIIHLNITEGCQSVVQSMQTLGLSWGNPENNENAELISQIPAVLTEEIPPHVSKAIISIWNDPVVQSSYKATEGFHILDSAEYFLSRVQTMIDPTYIPTEQDLLHVRYKTTGIIETRFKVKNTNYRVMDVGGQRSERRKWIHCFEDVTAILFLVALSDYDQNLTEGESINRIKDSTQLFDTTINSRWLANTTIVLFLNKIDLLKQKLHVSPMENYQTDFTEFKATHKLRPKGSIPAKDSSLANEAALANEAVQQQQQTEEETDPLFELAKSYFKKKFLSYNKNLDRRVFVHFTCATDTNQVQVILATVTLTIIEQGLKRIGFYV